MSTFLELVNRARGEAGAATVDLNTVVAGLNAESKRFANWVRDEWLDLQAQHDDWLFLHSRFAFDTVIGQGDYTPVQAEATVDGTGATASILADWDLDTIRVSTQGSAYSDESFLPYLPFHRFRALYAIGPARAARGRPAHFTVRPHDKALVLGPAPDAIYTVEGEFYRNPQTLLLDADEPLMPSRFHHLIAFKALRAYGIFMSAPEVIGRADEKIGLFYPQLCSDQLPSMELPPPLA